MYSENILYFGNLHKETLGVKDTGSLEENRISSPGGGGGHPYETDGDARRLA